MVMFIHTVSPFRIPPAAYGFSHVAFNIASWSSGMTLSIDTRILSPTATAQALFAVSVMTVFVVLPTTLETIEDTFPR